MVKLFRSVRARAITGPYTLHFCVPISPVIIDMCYSSTANSENPRVIKIDVWLPYLAVMWLIACEHTCPSHLLYVSYSTAAVVAVTVCTGRLLINVIQQSLVTRLQSMVSQKSYFVSLGLSLSVPS